MFARAIDAALEWFARHDYFKHYRTAREAVATRGTIMVGALAWAGLSLGAGFREAPGGSLAVLAAVLGSFTPALLTGFVAGGLLGLRVPRNVPYGDWGLLLASRGGRLTDEALQSLQRAWLREDAWLPLDGRLSLGRPRQSLLGLLPGSGALETVVAAEHDQATGTAFAGTDWRSPGSSANRVWVALDCDPSLIPRQDAESFMRYFSEEAVEARWEALPAEARAKAEGVREQLLSNARKFAAGRRAALESLGGRLDGVPLFAAHDLAGGGNPAAFAATLLTHEAGHVRLAAWYGDLKAYALESRQWDSVLAGRLLEAQPVPVSLYALFTPAEYFAEHYAAWRGGHAGITEEMGRLLSRVAYGEPLD